MRCAIWLGLGLGIGVFRIMPKVRIGSGLGQKFAKCKLCMCDSEIAQHILHIANMHIYFTLI